AALRRLDQLARGGDTATAAVLRQRWFERVQTDATAGRMTAARALLDAYLDYDPYDVEALLLDADLRQMQGRGLAALDPLLALLQFSDDGDAVARARAKLALLVGVHETQLANRGEVSALIRFFEDLTVRDPSHDGHRLRLARWLLQGGRAADAERVLAQTGVAGVDPQARADLLADVRLARSGLPLEYGDNAMHVRASLGGRPLRLLVDTGATTTVISRDRAIALGASATGERVLVRTAAGLVEAELHRVMEFELGALQLEALTVLVLDQRLPDGVDGLLGMDVITRFGGAGRAGLPFSAESR
ncbi:MAG: TIGR02281 family clan AA aspartic protease, partial [Pseudomonadales bacterium]